MRTPCLRPVALALAVAGALPLVATSAATAADPSTDLVSVSSTGAKGNSDSLQPDISADGRWVAFSSFASNLAPSANGRDSIFLRDRLRGETRQVSAGVGGAPPNGASSRASISDDGRFVAFYSAATNLTATPGGYQAYVYDRDQGTLRRVSTNVAPTSYYRHVNDAEVSGDGRWVVFHAENLDTSRTDVFLHDVASGAVRRLGEPSPGVQASSSVNGPSVSGDGRWVAYSSAAALVAGDANGRTDIFVEDLATGAKERVSLTSTDGEANDNSSSAALNHDGCVVAFVSSATNLVAGASDAGSKAFVRDRCSGDTEAVSVSNAGTVGTVSGGASISGDGCAVAFATRTVLVPAPPALATAVRDRCRGLTSRADVSTAGEPSNGAAAPNSVSLGGAHGRYVAFMSFGGNLAGIDGDGFSDIFVRDRANNVAPTALLQLSQDGSSVTVDASGSRDPDGYQLTGAVNFGDGSPDAGGLAVTHRYARGGSYTVALTVTDADGATARAFQTVTVPDPPPGGGGGDGGGGGTLPPGGAPGGGGPGGGAGSRPPALRLTGAKLSRTRFAVAPARGRPSGNEGATFSASLSERATVTLTLERELAGRRVRGRCVAGAPRGGRGRCVVRRTVGTIRRTAGAGRLSVPLTGRLGRRSLQLGRHRLRVVAAAEGRRAQSVLLFTIVPRSAR